MRRWNTCPFARDHTDGMRPAPVEYPVATADRGHPEKIDAAAALLRVDPSLIMLPEAAYSAHPDKAGHPGAGSTLPWSVGEVMATA